MAGIRTSAVWVIGTATLSTPIGQTSLGNYIFAGLQTQNWVFVLFGCVAAAVLALVVDQLLALMEHGVAVAPPRIAGGRRRRPACWWCWPRCCPRFGRAQGTIVIGAKPFTEQYVLAALIEQRLEARGAAGAAARRARLRRHLQCARRRRDRCLCRLFRHASGPTRCTAPTSSRAPKCWPRWRAGSKTTHGIRMLGRARLRERLCAGDAARRAPKSSASVRSPILAAHAGAAVDRRRLRILRAPRMEGDPRRLRPAFPRAAHHAGRLHVSGRGAPATSM